MTFNDEHGLFIYGQQRADGWACRDCRWQTYNIQWDRDEAQQAHDEQSPRCPAYVAPGSKKSREASPQKED